MQCSICPEITSHSKLAAAVETKPNLSLSSGRLRSSTLQIIWQLCSRRIWLITNSPSIIWSSISWSTPTSPMRTVIVFSLKFHVYSDYVFNVKFQNFSQHNPNSFHQQGIVHDFDAEKLSLCEEPSHHPGTGRQRRKLHIVHQRFASSSVCHWKRIIIRLWYLIHDKFQLKCIANIHEFNCKFQPKTAITWTCPTLCQSPSDARLEA